MTTPSTSKLAQEVLAAVRGFVGRSLAPRDARLDTLERRLDALEAGGAKNVSDSFRGAYREGATYRRGQTVVHRGSLYLCLDDTLMRPSESDCWRRQRGPDGGGAR